MSEFHLALRGSTVPRPLPFSDNRVRIQAIQVPEQRYPDGPDRNRQLLAALLYGITLVVKAVADAHLILSEPKKAVIALFRKGIATEHSENWVSESGSLPKTLHRRHAPAQLDAP